MGNLLYLGLDPSHFPESKKIVHYPVIQILLKNTEELNPYFQRIEAFSHFLFTSKTTVDLFFEFIERQNIPLPSDKTYIAIGAITEKWLNERGIDPLVAPNPTQEGVMELMISLDTSNIRIFYPHSSIARRKLAHFLEESQVDFLSIPLYDTTYRDPQKGVSWDSIDQIAFTSPSTVDGFFRLHRNIPEHVEIWCQGPITKTYLEKRYCRKNAEELHSFSR